MWCISEVNGAHNEADINICTLRINDHLCHVFIDVCISCTASYKVRDILLSDNISESPENALYPLRVNLIWPSLNIYTINSMFHHLLHKTLLSKELINHKKKTKYVIRKSTRFWFTDDFYFNTLCCWAHETHKLLRSPVKALISWYIITKLYTFPMNVTSSSITLTFEWMADLYSPKAALLSYAVAMHAPTQTHTLHMHAHTNQLSSLCR